MSTPEFHRQTVRSEDQSQPGLLLPADVQSRNRAPTSAQPTTSEPVCNVSQPTTTTPLWTGHNVAHYPPRSHPFPPLHIHTDFPSLDRRPVTPLNENDTLLRQSISSTSLPRRAHSVRVNTMSSTESLSPSSVRSSAISSPALAAMADITPLPSPIGYLSPASWRTGGRTVSSHSLSRTSSTISRSASYLSLRLSDSTQLLRTASSRSRSRRYSSTRFTGSDLRESGLEEQEEPRGHSRNRSLSEHIPKKGAIPLSRPDVSSRAALPAEPSSQAALTTDSNNLHREQFLAVRRGLTLPTARPPTPPRSTRSGDEEADSKPIIQNEAADGAQNEIYCVRSIRTKQPRRYRKLRQLGQGTFSQVSLAVRIPDDATGKDGHVRMPSLMSQKLVAVKVIEYGPAGGADEERVEVSLKREVEILKSVNHPSLVQLKAFGSDDKRALLVLDYCPGGDLFDFATSDMKYLMKPPLIRRMFAEMVGAVRYLHANYIVHRDIKLENVLVNLPPSAMEQVSDWCTYDRAVITISDLGLSRRIPEPPESPLLHTRCGSEDYAAPEILMGQPYDGRSTDAWALGVLLYAMMENRLPFDARPGTRGDPAKLRARTPHRIARCEWSWYRYADEDEEWDPVKGKELEGARECVEGLLKRHSRRKNLDQIAQLAYVKDALDLDGELKRGDKEVP